MIKTETPLKTPSPADSLGPRKVGKSPTAIFITMALDMSWRLAVAILVPVIGGYELDRKLKTSPLLFVVGLIITMVGTGLVLWQTLKVANNTSMPDKKAKP